MQGQIRVNQAKTDQLGDQINEAEKKDYLQQKATSSKLKTVIYVESTVSSLEMLASSSNLE
jgi:hypothetical protein